MALDLTGQRFGKLVALEISEHGKNRKWLCRCDCGGVSVVAHGNLRSGNSKSCGGCRNWAKPNLKHGFRPGRGGYNPTYVSWRSMRYRCRDPQKARYYAGVTYDPRWDDFAEFLADMGERPPGMTLDRIDGNKGYSKENCRWATPLQQTHNRRKRGKPNEDRICELGS